MKREQVKQWVAIYSHVTSPYGKYWSASVTLGMDINGTGDTIEEAYNSLTDIIMISPEYYKILAERPTFKSLNP